MSIPRVAVHMGAFPGEKCMIRALDGILERFWETKSERFLWKNLLWAGLDSHSAGCGAHGAVSYGKVNGSRSGRPLGTLLGNKK